MNALCQINASAEAEDSAEEFDEGGGEASEEEGGRSERGLSDGSEGGGEWEVPPKLNPKA